jgi:NAD(P)-dependent dehydrogenase (short-subunit alcohol dehydrogenase family)
LAQANEPQLENKIAVVTGGAQGLGQAISGALAKAGCHVAIADMKDEAAQATAAEIAKEPAGRRSR